MKSCFKVYFACTFTVTQLHKKPGSFCTVNFLVTAYGMVCMGMGLITAFATGSFGVQVKITVPAIQSFFVNEEKSLL